MLQCLVGTPSGTAKTNTNDTIIVTAMATDQDANDTLTYTLWYGTSADSITTKGVSSDPTKQGTSVMLTQAGLSNDTMYYFKVAVSDGTDIVESNSNNIKTYCLGIYCNGGGYNYLTCSTCNGNKTTTCSACSGSGSISCSTCSGHGSVACRSCSGSGEKPCTTTNIRT
ncbi:MAG: hypothetical protein HFJ25_06250 [Clostridia bacterium]|nr:hypothetical protein [Clostridia bacterium]